MLNDLRILVLAFSVLLASAAVSTSAAEPEKPAPPAPEFHAGYHKFKLTYRPVGTENDVEGPACLWYPTAEEAPEYNYRGQVGFVKEEAAVAPGKHPLILFSHGFM